VKVPEYLNTVALEILLAELRRFGNKLNDDHANALKKLLSAYTGMARGELTGRVAFPLATGLGKTSSIRAWIIAAHQEGLLGTAVSLAVACSRVEALADLKRDLVSAGVPAEQIGLIHSYRYDPEIARAVLARERELPEGYATEPRTDDCTECPVVLVSHNKVIGGRDRRAYETYRGKERNLIVWDESLISTEAVAVSTRQLTGPSGYIPLLKDHTHGDALAFWLHEAMAAIDAEVKAQLAGAAPTPMTLMEVDDEDMNLFRAALKAVERSERCDLSGYRTLLDFSGDQARVCVNVGISDGNMAAVYGLRVPDRLKMIVLDASASIRLLQTMDPTLRVIEVSETAKRWNNVTVKHMKAPGGRTGIEGHFRKPRTERWLSQELARIIHEAPADEGFVIFSFKHNGGGNTDVLGTLRADLQHHGVDLTSTVRGAKGDERPRIMTATWGQETSLNSFAHCRHVILLGVYRQDRKDIVASILGQKRNLLEPIDRDMVDAVAATELAHVVYQALSRGQSRVVAGGQAGAMTAYVVERDTQDRLRSDLEPVMPGATWEDWKRPEEAGKLPGRPAKLPGVVEKLKLELGDIVPKDVREMRKLVPGVCEGINGETLRRALLELKEAA
jgi:hypothetical protein